MVDVRTGKREVKLVDGEKNLRRFFSPSTNFTSLLPVLTTLAFTGLNGN